MKSANIYLRIASCFILMFALVLVMASCDTVSGVIGSLAEGDFGGALDAIIGDGNHEHDYVATETPATCTEQGYTTYTCECGESYVDDYVKAGHDLVANAGKFPTCTESGHDAYRTCSRCDYTTYHAIPAKGHDYETKVTRYPTTLTKGVITAVCANCGNSTTEEIEAVTVTLPSVAQAIRDMIGQNELTVDAEDSELVLIKEISTEGETKYEKTFLAFEIAHLEVSGKFDDLHAYLSLSLGVAGFETLEEGAEPVFESQLLINVLIYGDDVSVAITEDGELSNGSFNISDAFYTAVAETFGMSYDQLIECYYMAGQLTAYLPLAEGVANWLASIEIPEGNVDLATLLAFIGENVIIVADTGLTTTYTVNISALGALLVSVQDMTLAEIIDAQYGEGTMDKVEEFILSLPNTKIKNVANSAISFSESCGVEIDAVYALINYVIYSASGVDFNIESEIIERYDMTVAEVIVEISFGEAAPTKQEISEAATALVANIQSVVDTAEVFTVDQLLSIFIYGTPDYIDPNGNPVSVTDQLASLLEMIDEATYFIAVVNNETGEMLMASVSVEGAFTVNYNTVINKVVDINLYLEAGHRLNINLSDGEHADGAYITLYDEHDPENSEVVFEGDLYNTDDGTGSATVLSIKYLENQIFNAELYYLADGSFDKFTLDVYKVVYDYEYVYNKDTGYESRTEEMKVHHIIDLDVVNTDGSYVITNKINGIEGLGHGGEDELTGNYTESLATNTREVALQTIIYTVGENGFTITMTTVANEETVQSATVEFTELENGAVLNVYFDAAGDIITLVIDSNPEKSYVIVTFNENEIFAASVKYEGEELVYADLIVNAIIKGEIEGYEELENLLNVITAVYEKGEGEAYKFDFVFNRLNTYMTPDEYIEETDEYIEGDTVREFINVIDFALAFDGTETYTAELNGTSVEVVNTLTDIGREISIKVTEGDLTLADVVIATQTFKDDSGEVEVIISEELHVKGTILDSDVAFSVVETAETFDLTYAVDSQDMIVISLLNNGSVVKNNVIINDYVYVNNSDSPVLENVLTYRYEDYLGSNGNYVFYMNYGSLVYDISYMYTTGTETLDVYIAQGDEVLVNAEVDVFVTETETGLDVSYNIKNLLLTLYSYENKESGKGEDVGNDVGGTPGSPEVDYPIDYDGSPVTIVFYHTMGYQLQAVLDQYIAEFNEMYPNITVEHYPVGGYDDVRDQINMEIAVGTQPNIAYCYPDHVALYNVANAVVPLDSFINDYNLGFTAEELEGFIDGFYAEGSMFDEEGTMYTLPMSKSTEVLYYNKTFFEEHGLSVPTTWDELAYVCERILEIDPYCTPFGYDSEANWFITMCEQLCSPYTSVSEDHYLFNNDTNREFVKMFREWYDMGYFTTQELYGGYLSGLFTGESCYLYIGSSAGSRHSIPASYNGVASFEVGIAPVPQVDVNNPKVISQGPSLCILNQKNKQEVVASWLFVKFLTTDPEFQADFSMASGYIPVIERDVLVEQVPVYGMWLESGDGLSQANASAYAISVALGQMDAYFVSPAFNGSSKARDEVGYLMQYCFVAQTDDIDAMIEKAFYEAIAECEYYS